MPHGFAESEFCTAITDVKYSGRITTRAIGDKRLFTSVRNLLQVHRKSLYLTIQRTIVKVQIVLNCTEHTKLFTKSAAEPGTTVWACLVCNLSKSGDVGD